MASGGSRAIRFDGSTASYVFVVSAIGPGPFARVGVKLPLRMKRRSRKAPRRTNDASYSARSATGRWIGPIRCFAAA
jgi:hypothetical protein